MRFLFGVSLAVNVILIALAIWGYFGWIALKAEVLNAIADREFAERFALKLGEHAKTLESRLEEARHDLDLLRKR